MNINIKIPDNLYFKLKFISMKDKTSIKNLHIEALNLFINKYEKVNKTKIIYGEVKEDNKID